MPVKEVQIDINTWETIHDFFFNTSSILNSLFKLQALFLVDFSASQKGRKSCDCLPFLDPF